MAHSSTTTKSIDVGSMFLMDLSIHESDLSCGDLTDIDSIHDNDSVFPANLLMQQSTHTNSAISKHRSDYLMDLDQFDSSLNRLANAISRDCLEEKTTSTVELHETKEKRNSSSLTTIDAISNAIEDSTSSSSSLNESFVVSEGRSEGSSATNSLSASYLTNSEVEDEERGSATTREDSGVLDMRDLDSQLNDSFDDKLDGGPNLDRIYNADHQQSHNQISRAHQINSTFTNSNLSQKDCKINNQLNWQVKLLNSSSNNNHLKQHHQHRERSDRSMSASLPIKVPVRQMMKNDMRQLKLYLSGKNDSTECQSDNRMNQQQTNAASDDFEEFLEQEYNDNHHNHYPANNYEREHLKADKNPMELFESIQALAKSLHEDAGLFGSLPPKRLLESPIRSLALA